MSDPRRSSLVALAAAGVLLVPASAMASGPLGPGAPAAPVAPSVAAPRAPTPAPVIAPQVPVVPQNPATFAAPTTPSTTAPSSAKGTGEGLTINGGPAPAAAPSTAKGAGGTVLTINGADMKGATAPSTTTPQKPSGGSTR